MVDELSLFDDKKISILSWLASIVICFQYICALISISHISIFLALGLMTVSFYLIISKKVKVLPSFVIIVVFIFIIFGISLLRVGDKQATLMYLEYFLLYDIIAFFIGCQVNDKEDIIKKVVIIGIVGLPLFLRINIESMESSNRMGFAYACLPILLSSLIALKFNKRYIIISLINILIFLFKFSTFAPRGIWVIICTYICYVLFEKMCIGKGKSIRVVSAFFLIICFITLAVLLFANLDSIVSMINDFLVSKLNIKIYALEKYIRYMNQGKLSNGRDELWNLASTLITKKPIFGNGIGFFESVSEGSYCHNFFIQSVCEAGVLFVVPAGIYFIKNIFRILKSSMMNYKTHEVWYIFSFCIGIEILLFSSVYWIYPLFWFFLGSFIRDSSDKNVLEFRYELYN